MDLSVIIVNYNVKEFLRHLISSIGEASKNITAEIIVVDNASDDGSVEMLRKEFPHVKLIANSVNLGFSKANNIGLQAAEGKYLLLLNPDTLVSEKTFDEMLKFFESHPEAGLAGCKILNPDGTLQLACRRGFPGPWTSFCKVTGLSSLFPKSRFFSKYNLTYLDENKTYEVDAISGSFMMMRREVYEKIGGLDEQFFMYGEDLDWCYRVQKAGYKVFYIHSTQIIHYKGESTKRSNIDETRVFYNAMHLFVRKHFSSYFIVQIILRFAIVLREIMAFLGRWRLIIAAVLADVLSFNLSLFISESIYASFRHWRGFPEESLIIVYTVPAAIQVFASMITGTYSKDRVLIIRSVLAAITGFFLVSSTTYFFKDFAYSRAVLLFTFIGAMTGFIFWRMAAKLLFGLSGKYSSLSARRALIVGTSPTACKIAERLHAKMTQYYTVVGLIGTSRREIGKKIGSVEIIGSLDTITKIVREQKINEIIFSTGELSYSLIMEQAAQLQNENVDFKIAGSNIDVLVGKKEVSLLDDISLVDLTHNLSLPVNRFVKRAFDIFVSAGIYILLPLIYIFAGSLRKNPVFKAMIGQLPLAISGKLSLIGPKQTAADQHSFGKPGITGYWFTEQEREENRNRLNLFYAKNQNIWLDVEILSKTFLILLRGR